MTTRPPEILVSFSISGRDFDLDECTRAIGRPATETWKQLKPQLAQRRDLANTTWTVAAAWAESDSLNETIGAFLPEILPYSERISEFIKKHGLRTTVQCSIRVWSNHPLYTLDTSTMKGLISIDAELGLDIYHYHDENT